MKPLCLCDRQGWALCEDLGDWKYVRSFGSKGKGQAQFICPWCLAVDSTGRVFVADKDNHRVQIFTKNGEFLYAFGDKDGELNCPRGVGIESDRYVYVSDNHRVQKFDITGQFICRIDSDGDGLKSAIGICVTDDEPCEVFVADDGNKCIRVYSQ